MRLRPLSACLFLFFLAGCSGLKHEDTFEVKPAKDKGIIIDPVSKDQTVKVEFTAEGGPVNVHCFLVKDDLKARNDINAKKKTDRILGSMEKAEEGSFEVVVPANEELTVLISAATNKKATGTIKLTGR